MRIQAGLHEPLWRSPPPGRNYRYCRGPIDYWVVTNRFTVGDGKGFGVCTTHARAIAWASEHRPEVLRVTTTVDAHSGLTVTLSTHIISEEPTLLELLEGVSP